MSFLLSALSLGGQCDMNYKQAKDQRLHTELWLMKLANLRNVLDWNAFPTYLNGGRPVDISAANPVVAEKKYAPSTFDSPPLAIKPTQSADSHPVTSEPVNGYYPTSPANGVATNGKAPVSDHSAATNGTAMTTATPAVAEKPSIVLQTPAGSATDPSGE